MNTLRYWLRPAFNVARDIAAMLDWYVKRFAKWAAGRP